MTSHPTGIHKLDELLGGGLAPHAALLVRHDDRVPPHPFIYQIFATQPAGDVEAVLLNLETPKASIEEELARLGFRPHARAHLMDRLGGARTLEEVTATLRSVIQDHPNALVVPPRLDSLAKRFGTAAVRTQLGALFESLAAASASIWCASESLLAQGLASAAKSANLVLRLGRAEALIGTTQEFVVERCTWNPASEGARHAYAVLRPGGVLLHVPKVLVTGPHDAGKSEFIRTACGSAASIETSGTTVALDHGQVQRNGVLVDLIGTPGQERFEPVIRRLARGALGVILVVDASRPETLPRAKHLVEHTWQPGLPLVVAANRPDAPNALTPTELKAELGLAASVPVLPCHANRREGAVRVLDALVDVILRTSPR